MNFILTKLTIHSIFPENYTRKWEFDDYYNQKIWIFKKNYIILDFIYLSLDTQKYYKFLYYYINKEEIIIYL